MLLKSRTKCYKTYTKCQRKNNVRALTIALAPTIAIKLTLTIAPTIALAPTIAIIFITSKI